MATAAREVVASPPKPKRHKARTDIAARASRENGRLGGRPGWEPEIQRKEITPGVWREETQDEAWQRARQMVRHCVAIGYPAEVICRLMQPTLDDKTLRKHFAYEIENGKLVQDMKVAGTGFYMATSGRHGDMTRFWLRARMGWRDHGDIPSAGEEIRFKKIEGDDW